MRIGEPPRGKALGCDDPDQPAVTAQRQQSCLGSLDQFLIAERAVGARHAVERFVSRAERCRERRKIDFLGEGIRANQHPLGAETDSLRAAFGSGNDLAGQEGADTIDFRTRAWGTA